jgi:hypothetical protein
LAVLSIERVAASRLIDGTVATESSAVCALTRWCAGGTIFAAECSGIGDIRAGAVAADGGS